MARMFLLYPAVVAVLVGIEVTANEATVVPKVEAPVGTLLGHTKQIDDVSVEVFSRIPYAKPPVGERRFALPEPFGAVEQTKAPEVTPWCPQPSLVVSKLPTQEDCLYLNVFRKAGTKAGDNKPVIAVIHGGAFSMGSGTDPLHNTMVLAGVGDVITVNLNYRLGVFGFADMKDLAPGNLGLYDQRLALEWIQDNIRSFGGDPDKVTLMGVSAGSMSVSAQIMTPLNRGQGRQLFHAAIMDGGVLATGLVRDADISLARMKKMAETIGCKSDLSEMVDCLRKADAEGLLMLSFDLEGFSPIFTFLPTVDGNFIPRDFSTEVAKNASDFLQVKTMIGFAKDEGTMFASYMPDFTGDSFPNLTTEAKFLDWCEKIAFGYKYPIHRNCPDTRKAIAEVYYEKHSTRRLDVAAFLKDGTFACPINAFLESYSKTNPNIYVYTFERKLRQPYMMFDPEKLGVMHGSPFLHMTGSPMTLPMVVPNATTNAEDRLYFLDSVRMVSEFVRSEDPPKFRDVEWPNYSKGEGVMVFDEKNHIINDLKDVDERCGKVFSSYKASA